ncbi:hypothetical protein [Acinetobacter sp. ANC 5502]
MNIIAQNMPHDSVVPIILKNNGYHFYSGTGFFVYFPQFVNDIFFVTARHCLKDDSKDLFLGDLKIPYKNSTEVGSPVIGFECFLETSYRDSEDQSLEDIIIGVVKKTTLENHKVLKERALRILHQDDVDFLLENTIKVNGNFRTLGYPSVSKEIIYDDEGLEIKGVSKSRGFYGKFKKSTLFDNWYEMTNTSWKEGQISGFSGSPIIELIPKIANLKEVEAVPLGVLVTEKHFISINVVTNTIANYFVQKRNETPD